MKSFKWFSDLINPQRTNKDANSWLQVVSFIVAASLAYCGVFLIFKGSITGENAVWMLMGFVMIFTSASGLVALSNKAKEAVEKTAEEKTKRAIATPPATPKTTTATDTPTNKKEST